MKMLNFALATNTTWQNKEIKDKSTKKLINIKANLLSIQKCRENIINITYEFSFKYFFYDS